LNYRYNPPLVIKKLFKAFYWNTLNGKVLLTFDDGPTVETTEIILAALSQHQIKALFFCVGNNIANNHSLAKEIIDEGHLIGNHTFNHKRLSKISNAKVVEEIVSFNNLMKEKFNYDVKYFRPPYGRFTISTRSIPKEKNPKCVMWSLLTQDYRNDFETVKFAVTNYLKKNSIVVLHDSIKSKEIIKDSINFIVDEAAKNGYTFGEPEECLRQSS
jgi:peptidoglycan/xylan/chitin deacetylase (PgdA/CDA1 family)